MPSPAPAPGPAQPLSGGPSPSPEAQASLARRMLVLESSFRQIAAQRMRGLPLLHPALRVQALGFVVHEPELHALAPGLALHGQVGNAARQITQQGQGLRWASGVLITPWFMNLVRLPLQALSPERALEAGWLGPGERASRRIGHEQLDFLGAVEGDAVMGELGAFETCSLFSPMFEFVDQAAAEATAREVLKLLHATEPATAFTHTNATAPPQPARRGFLFGRLATLKPKP